MGVHCPTGAVSAAHCEILRTNQTVPAVGANQAITFDHFETNDQTVFATGDAVGIKNAAGDTALYVLKAGCFMFWFSGQMEDGAYGRAVFASNGAHDFVQITQSPDNVLTAASPAFSGNLNMMQSYLLYVGAAGAGGTMTWFVTNTDVVNRNLDRFWVSALWIDQLSPSAVY